jgi:cytochrome c oxidase subunit 1
LEWATSSPPPRHNFVFIPRVRSESPAFDLRHPQVATIELAHDEATSQGRFADAPSKENRAELLRDLDADLNQKSKTDDDR